MSYTQETDENIQSALASIEAIRHFVGSGKPNELIFDKYARCCALLNSAGEFDEKSLKQNPQAFFDATKLPKSKYFGAVQEDSQYNPYFNMASFFATHGGSGEQFATALSMIFANSKNIRCYPIKFKLKISDDGGTHEEFKFANLTQFFDDYGTMLHSCYINLFDGVANTDSLDDFIKSMLAKNSSKKQSCQMVEPVGLNYYPPSIDLGKNFTILETLTDQGGVEFNFFGYEMDRSDALFEKCGKLSNYISKKQLKSHLDNFISPDKNLLNK